MCRSHALQPGCRKLSVVLAARPRHWSIAHSRPGASRLHCGGAQPLQRHASSPNTVRPFSAKRPRAGPVGLDQYSGR